jgi:hypothetical protein
MSLSAFNDPRHCPTEQALLDTLGRAHTVWSRLTDELCDGTMQLELQWAFAGEKFGWSARLKHGTRIIVYLTPCRGHFLASFALGTKACAAMQALRLPSAIRDLIDRAPQYAEGRGVRIPIRTQRDARVITKLAAIKLAH